jgi:hypothetical protein
MADASLMVAAWAVPGLDGLWARHPTMDPRLIWATLGLVGILLFGALAIWWVDRWRKRSLEPKDASVDAQLAQFRNLYEQGALSAEEYERIRALLGKRLREELELLAPRPSDGTAPGPGMPPLPPPADPPRETGPPQGPLP